MIRARVRDMLARIADGTLSIEEGLRVLAVDPIESLGHTTVDHHRSLRQGYPEVIFGQGKTTAQIIEVAQHIAARGDGVLATRLSDEAAAALQQAIPGVVLNASARTAYLAGSEAPEPGKGSICIVTAGTSDLPVADEAAVTAQALGNAVVRVTDVGVAGLHRLLARRDELLAAAVVIVVAGMDGALPSVVGGIVARPVIAVPTSVGYGAALGGIAPLLTMLNSCASGVTVVNIDNGFGAAVAASRITHD